MAGLYVLFEHAAGYALFATKEFEEIGALLPEVEASVSEISRFNSVVHVVGFSAFKTGAESLANANAVSEGLVTEELQLFLDSNLPAKRKKVTVGVADARLGSAIGEALGVKCLHVDPVPEILRGIRTHFNSMVKGFSDLVSAKSCLGLAHAYSRCKVKFNVNKSDNMIIQSIALLDQLDKDINTFSMRIREWYSYHFPELVRIVPNNYMYARCALVIRNRKELGADEMSQLEEIVLDSAKTQAILDASKSSMGMDISPLDLINIERFAKRVVALSEYRLTLQNYLATRMKQVAPNLGELIGDTVAARLISHAGSLTNLAKYPASTVQILGAEKALFRALKTRGNTPKYGLLFHSTFIGRAGVKNKGRISRYLANKCSLASRIDCFSEETSSVFGQKLRDQVEERLKFYESGEMPRKNIDVMKEASEENAAALKKIKKKKKRKSKGAEETNGHETAPTNGVNGDTNGHTNGETENGHVEKKKKKKRKSQDVEEAAAVPVLGELVNNGNDGTPPAKKKKKKRQSEVSENGAVEESAAVVQEPSSKKKKKKRKSMEVEMEVE